MRSESLHPQVLPSQRAIRHTGQEGEVSTFPLETYDLTHRPAGLAPLSLRQIYSAAILKIQRSLSFIAEIKQTRKKEQNQQTKKPALVSSPES